MGNFLAARFFIHSNTLLHNFYGIVPTSANESSPCIDVGFQIRNALVHWPFVVCETEDPWIRVLHTLVSGSNPNRSDGLPPGVERQMSKMCAANRWLLGLSFVVTLVLFWSALDLPWAPPPMWLDIYSSFHVDPNVTLIFNELKPWHKYRYSWGWF
jgi:hypothetical protein